MPRFVFVSAIALLLIFPSLAKAQQLTPENVIDLLYTHVKRVNYRPLLDISVDPERKRITALLKSLETDRAAAAEVRRRANALTGYTIHATEIHDTVAAVMFVWQYRNEQPAAQQSDIRNPSVIESGCEAVLLKENGIWMLASTRPWVPDNERGAAFIRQQKEQQQKSGRR